MKYHLLRIAAGAVVAATLSWSGCHADMMGGANEMRMQAGMRLDRSLMRRHATELAEVARKMRLHLTGMRQASADHWPARMSDHVEQVFAMVDLIHRQLREMADMMCMRMEMLTHAQMGMLVGVEGDAHARMMEEVSELRTEAEQLATATVEQLVLRMPAHLDRLERMIRTIETSAAHMRRM